LEFHFFYFAKFWWRTKIRVIFNIFMSQCCIFIFALIFMFFFSESKSV
jgi:hypothetical protein